jgi:hypothetical protein
MAFFFEAEMNKSSKNSQCSSNHSFWEKLGFGNRLGEVWRDTSKMIRIGNMNSYPQFNYLKNRSFGIPRTMMSSLVPIGFGVAGPACFRQQAILFGWL